MIHHFMIHHFMIHRFVAFVIALVAGLLIASGPASAHPHVWVIMTTEIVYGPDGAAVGVRHAWTFDDMYSAFATQDLQSKTKGEFTREELAPLAEVNATSLKEYDFFTQVTANGKKVEFVGASDYWLEYKDSVLTLFYTLMFKQPVQARNLLVSTYDPEYFVDFTFAEKNPVKLTGAPADCKFRVIMPQEASVPGAQRLPDAAASQPDTMNFGEQFASRIAVECPMFAAAAIESAQAEPQVPPTPRAPSGASQSGGLIGWIMAKQAEFNQAMRSKIRDARQDGSAVWGLLLLSFLYGIFHAAGPGHGKAVISSYLVANDETWRRGVVLSFASAFLQAVVAVTLVGLAVAVFQATTRFVCDMDRIIEIVSYALIALIGARLLWVKGRGFVNAAQAMGRRPLHAMGADVTRPKGHGQHEHDDEHRDHGHRHHVHHDHHHHAHHHAHHHHDHDDHASAWGHAHGPEPEELAGPGGWKRGLSAIVAVGLRPCSGAILVLVFALAQGLLWVGVASTFTMALGTAITVAAIATLTVFAKSFAGRVAHSQAGYGMLFMRGIEVAAALVVLAFGTLLLVGYLTAERMPAMACG